MFKVPHDPQHVVDFVRESNRIEGILRDPTADELTATSQFLELDLIGVSHVEELVSVYQPRAVLRERPGLDVVVGNHRPPPGEPGIRIHLDLLLARIHGANSHPYEHHLAYEELHPFTDGNGRSGRALWAWQMLYWGIQPGLQLGFLHAFYYQTLERLRPRTSDWKGAP